MRCVVVMGRMSVLFGIILISSALAGATSDDGGNHHCVWYGRCGRDPKFGDDRHILNCLYRGPPKRAPAVDVDKARNSEMQISHAQFRHFDWEMSSKP